MPYHSIQCHFSDKFASTCIINCKLAMMIFFFLSDVSELLLKMPKESFYLWRFPHRCQARSCSRLLFALGMRVSRARCEIHTRSA